MKLGCRVANVIPNLILTTEYTRTNPLAYRNDNLTTLFTSNSYNLGHYLYDNADVLYLAADFKPTRGLHLRLFYEKARKGTEYPYIRMDDPVTGIPMVHGKKFMQEVIWEQSVYGLQAEYQLINDMYIFTSLEKKDAIGNEARYAAPFFLGDLLVFSGGFNIGF
jgi:hypothetical protein